MKNNHIISLMLVAVFSLVACSGGGGGSSGTTTVGTPTVPAGAVTFDNSSDTEDAAQVVVSNFLGDLLLDSVLAVDVSLENISAIEILTIVRNKIEKRDRSATTAVVGPTYDYPCSSGFIHYSWTEITDTADLYEESGTADFDNCTELGITIDGAVQYEYSENYQTSEYHDSGSSSSITASDGSVSVALTNFTYDYQENWGTGIYELSTFQFAVEPNIGGGFTVMTTSSIMGNWNNFCELNAGVIELTGANNTQGKITINNNDTVTVEYDDGGGFTPTDNSPMACLY